MTTYRERLLESIQIARRRADSFFENTIFRHDVGWLYTATHDTDKYPAALLYGTWSGILGLHLLGRTKEWGQGSVDWALQLLNAYRKADGSFFSDALEGFPTSKSREYLTLHCTNYSLGAALVLDPDYDFQTAYLDRFLDGDYLRYWLDARSLLRPWEEGNNIVNVAAYLALLDEHGDPKAASRLSQLYDWHTKHQNPKTAGFDVFLSPSFKQHFEALAGGVHNFHLHMYLGKKFGHEEQIYSWVEKFLVQGQLTACQSIDFVELAVRTLPYSDAPQRLVDALIMHTEALLANQQSDGGWLENDNGKPTVAAGFVDQAASSCSYATWFRLGSLGMIAVTLLGDSVQNWHFRKTLGMGYAPDKFPTIPVGAEVRKVPFIERKKKHLSVLPNQLKKKIISLGGRLFG